jgi:hypothetical protein
MQKAKTHFEQIPVAIVKRIAEVTQQKEESGNGNVVVETPSAKTEPYSVSAAVQCRNRAW